MRSFKIGLLLGWRQIQRANRWTTFLIIFVMTLTFLNLIAVSGILVGLIAGSERAVQEKSIGDIIITELDNETKIIQTETILSTLNTIPSIKAYTARYKTGGSIEANYKTRRDLGDEPNRVNSSLVGIDTLAEDAVTALSKNVVEGEYLQSDESGYVLLGALNLDRYTAGFADITGSLENVYPGEKVRITIGENTAEFIVKGIINAKAGEVASQVYLPERELRRLTGQIDRDADEIAIRLVDQTPENANQVKQTILRSGAGNLAKIRTFNEALPKFITDIKNTFNILGIFIGAVGIIVASITIFIIIFINAISRQRQIGILKGIGIHSRAIKTAYILQASFYALLGSALGLIITYGFLIGYFEKNPINFPFSDGILVAEPLSSAIRFSILFIVTLLAGYVPATLIVRKNTLNSILGRK